MNEGFLGTAASGGADLGLLLEIAIGVGLLIGTWLVRLKRYRQHAWCQSVIVILNAALIVLTMIPAFRVQVLPRIPEKLGRGFYGLATTHAVLGTVTEVAGFVHSAGGRDESFATETAAHQVQGVDADGPRALVGCADTGDGNVCALVHPCVIPQMNLSVLKVANLLL